MTIGFIFDFMSLKSRFWQLVILLSILIAESVTFSRIVDHGIGSSNIKNRDILITDSKIHFHSDHHQKAIDGPVMDHSGSLYVGNLLQQGNIARKGPHDEKFIPWLTLPQEGRISSIRLGKNNLLLVADYKNHRIYKINLDRPNFESFFESKMLNQPNDLAISQDGSVYFTDPSWDRKKIGTIYKLNPEGVLSSIASDVRAANGIDLNPDENKLYFSESITGVIYELQLNGKAELKRIYKFKEDTVDGIQTDIYGNIFVARITEGKVDVISPMGKLIQSFSLSLIQDKLKSLKIKSKTLKDLTNISFGGEGGHSLFITIRQHALVLELVTNTTGRQWKITF